MSNIEVLSRPDISTAEAAVMQATQIVEALPSALPADYLVRRQPTYPDKNNLISNVAAVIVTERVTTPENVRRIGQTLEEIATGTLEAPIIITGRCAEPVYAASTSRRDKDRAVSALADEALMNREVVLEEIPTAIHLCRGCGQCAKPRTAATETLPDGTIAEPYMGCMINGTAVDERKPNPERMVTAAEQSRDLANTIKERLGEHMSFAHEGLLLPYEHAQEWTDPITGEIFSLGGDMIWGGVRTGDPEDAHIKLIGRLANPTAVKIGPSHTPEQIGTLYEKLNPLEIPGKLTFMLRMGLKDGEKLDRMAEVIAEKAAESLVMYDIHGVTRPVDKHKIRSVPEIVDNIGRTAQACGKAGLQLNGLHLETVGPDHDGKERLECVDSPDGIPTHPGGVDPELNMRQLRTVLQQTKHLLGNQC